MCTSSCFWTLSGVLVCLAFFGNEQVQAGGLIGEVVSGKVDDLVTGKPLPVPRAPITLCTSGNLAGDSCRDSITGSDGSFYFPDVPPGTYKVITPGSGDNNWSGQVVVPNSNDDVGVTIEAK